MSGSPPSPNAKYLVPKVDYEFWKRDGGHRPNGAALNRSMFEDSDQPVSDAVQILPSEEFYRIDGNLSLEPTPGHTPGSSAPKLCSDGDRAIFLGGVLHSPIQMQQPGWSTCLCEDAEKPSPKLPLRFLVHAAPKACKMR